MHIGESEPLSTNYTLWVDTDETDNITPQVLPLVERAENAARVAEERAAETWDKVDTLDKSISDLNTQVNEIHGEIAKNKTSKSPIERIGLYWGDGIVHGSVESQARACASMDIVGISGVGSDPVMG